MVFIAQSLNGPYAIAVGMFFIITMNLYNLYMEISTREKVRA